MEEKDFKKEFEEFARKIKEENNPIFDGDLEFDDLDNLISFNNHSEDIDFNNDSNNFIGFNNEFVENKDYPTIDLETENIKMSLTLKKDYSSINNLKDRKKEFINDLKDFIDEFDSTEESNELMKFYDN